jgi:hypothetical protein
MGAGIVIAAHMGDINSLRSYIFGRAIDSAYYILMIGDKLRSSQEDRILLVSQDAIDGIRESWWGERMQKLDTVKFRDDRLREIAEEFGVYQLIVAES